MTKTPSRRFEDLNLSHSCLFRISCFVLRISAAVILVMTIIGSAAAAEVRLRSSAGCSTSIVRLADVAEIHGDENLNLALAEIPLCPAPAAGNQRVLSQNDLRQLLTLSGVGKETVEITGSETVTVTCNPGGLRHRPVALGAVSTMVRQAVFATEIDISKKQPTMRTALRSDTLIAPSEQPETQRLVEKGASVMVHAQTGGIRIRTSGKALEAGSSGDTISVELADSREKVLARIVGPQLVEVTVGSANPGR
jgi:flagella basal body P-ring formation protein FlgA